jgi:hypothetical protein
MTERYTVHRVFNGQDEVLGHFDVVNGEIHFESIADQFNCGIFPPGPIAPMTMRKLSSLLDNHNKSMYITRG